jgi:site-specific DNA-methyltransferase (adenine-specific)
LKQGRHIFWVIPDKIPFPPSENGTGERLYMPVYSDTEQLATMNGLIPEFPIIWDKRGPNLSEQPWSKKMWGSYPYPVSIIHTPFTERISVFRKPGKHGLTQKDREDSKITSTQFNEWARDIWSIRISSYKDHPAPFPKEIPERIITLWSRKNDLVFDPFTGRGTTAIAALELNRHFYGCDKSQEYIELAAKNIDTRKAELSQVSMF